jgi:hypothetical protein
MAFERWATGGRSYKPKLTIRQGGQLGLNQGAVKRFQLDNETYAVLFYDPDGRRIGIKFTRNSEEEGVIKVITRLKSATVYAKPFLDYYAISYDKSRRFDLLWDASEELVVAALKE